MAKFRAMIRQVAYEQIEGCNFQDRKTVHIFRYGGCRYHEAHRTVQCIRDAIGITHGPVGCTYALKHVYHSSVSAPISNVAHPNVIWDEHTVVFGGEDKLRDAILEVYRRYRPGGIIVLATCPSGLIGDDIKGVVNEVKPKIDIPILAVSDCVGFSSFGDLGHTDVLAPLVDEWMEEPKQRIDKAINFVGYPRIDTVAPGGHLYDMIRVFQEIGIKVNMFIPAGASVDELRFSAPKASLNVVVCQKSGSAVATGMEKKFGTPYLQVSMPFGLMLTSNLVRKVAEFFGLERQAEELVKKEESQVWEQVRKYLPHLKGKKVVVSCGPYKTQGWASAFAELGLDVVHMNFVMTTEETLTETKRICEHRDIDCEVTVQATKIEMQEIYARQDLAFFSGEMEFKEIAAAGLPFYPNMSPCQPCMGYQGFKKLAKDLAFLTNYGFSHRYRAYREKESQYLRKDWRPKTR